MSDDVIKIAMTKSLFEMMATRTEEGKRIHVELGEPDEDGFHTPALTVDYKDDIVEAYRPAAEILAAFPGVRAKYKDMVIWDHARKRFLGVKA